MSEVPTNVADRVEQSVGKRLLHALLTELKMESPRFNTLPAEKQEETIERLRHGIEDAVNDAVRAISARSFHSVPAVVTSVTFKEGVKVTLDMVKSSQGVHAVADHVGGAVMVVLANQAEFTEGMADVKGQPNQGDLLQRSDDDEDGE